MYAVSRASEAGETMGTGCGCVVLLAVGGIVIKWGWWLVASAVNFIFSAGLDPIIMK